MPVNTRASIPAGVKKYLPRGSDQFEKCTACATVFVILKLVINEILNLVVAKWMYRAPSYSIFKYPTLESGRGGNLRKIMISEDESDLRDLITFTLRFANFEVVAASNGEEAVTLARQEFPDLILMDVRMPHMTGYEACTAIKADPKLKNIPIIFLSAKGQDSEIQAGLQAGALEYLLKPITPDQLSARIHAVLARYGK